MPNTDRIKGLFRRAAIVSSEPVKTEARTALLTLLYQENDFTSLRVLGRTFLESGSSSEKIATLLAEILYKEKRYEDLTDLLIRADHVKNEDLFFYKVMTWGILKKPNWHAVFTAFLVSIQADSDGEKRFLQIEQLLEGHGMLKDLSAGEKALLLFKVSAEQKKYHEALERAAAFFRWEKSRATGSQLLSAEVIDEIVKLPASSGRTAGLLTLFAALLPGEVSPGKGMRYSREVTAHLFWGAGYLSGRRRDPERAASYYWKGLPYGERKFSDKLLWYWFASEFRVSPSRALGRVAALVLKWHDPDYFSDILSDLASSFLREGKWQKVRDLLVKLQGKGSDDILSRLSYIVARGADEGYLTAADDTVLGWYRTARMRGRGVASGLYYKIMAQAALRTRVTVSSQDKGDTGTFDIFVPDEATGKDPPRSYDQLLIGAVQYNVPEYGKRVLAAYPRLFSLSAIRFFAGYLNRRGDYLDSIRIMSRYAAENGYRVTRDDIKILYPSGYSKIISSVRKKEHLPPPVFTALIREESHFSPTIVSAAGAVGLSQLMPATARDVAARMGLKSTDRTRPDVNAALGGWYLGNLLGRTDTVLDALFAYNGGLTRVRRWKRTYPGLPEDLFLEVLPYKETSLYGRKVLVTAVVYGYLYFDQTPMHVIQLFMNKRF